MQVKSINKTSTEVKLTIIAKDEELQQIKGHTLDHFKDQVKVPGFRAGNVPIELLEKHVDQNALQSKFLDEAIDQLYRQAVTSQKLRPVGQPKVTLTKFVPYSSLEFAVDVSIIGKVDLADYKNISVKKPEVKISTKDVSDILTNLQTRIADKKDVDRPAKAGDQVWIDFKGKDSKGKPVKGADGENYPLSLGSSTFIPGFEENLVGLKAGEKKSFTLSFPKNYGVSALQNKKVTFDVSVTKVQEVTKAKIDDDFAKRAGPFKTLSELKTDIKKQIKAEREQQVHKQYESEIVKKITDKSKVEVPQILIDEQLEHMKGQERQNAIYRGVTWEEYLQQQGLNEDEYTDKIKPIASERVKASIILSEIANKEHITLTKTELESQLSQLKQQYKDPQMLAQLDKPEAQNDIASRMMTEKTIHKIISYQK